MFQELFWLYRQIITSFLTPEHKSFPIPQAKQTKIPSLHITVCDINLRDKLIIASASRVHFEVLQRADTALRTHSFRHMTSSHVHVQMHIKQPEGDIPPHLNVLHFETDVSRCQIIPHYWLYLALECKFIYIFKAHSMLCTINNLIFFPRTANYWRQPYSMLSPQGI